jgi:hypothetical protein
VADVPASVLTLTLVAEAVVLIDEVGLAVIKLFELLPPTVTVLKPVVTVVSAPVMTAPGGVYVNNDNESVTIDTLPKF